MKREIIRVLLACGRNDLANAIAGVEYESTPAIDDVSDVAWSLYQAGLEEQAERLLKAGRTIRSRMIAGSIPDRSVMQSTIALFGDLGIRFAVIGGMAVIGMGHARGTQDVDILVEQMPPPEKIGNVDYMRRFGFYPAHSHTGTVVNIDHRKGGLEVQVAGTKAQKRALVEARDLSIQGVRIKTVTPEGLIALKVQALMKNPSRASKDEPDIAFAWRKATPKGVRAYLTDNEWQYLLSIVPRT